MDVYSAHPAVGCARSRHFKGVNPRGTIPIQGWVQAKRGWDGDDKQERGDRRIASASVAYVVYVSQACPTKRSQYIQLKLSVLRGRTRAGGLYYMKRRIIGLESKQGCT